MIGKLLIKSDTEYTLELANTSEVLPSYLKNLFSSSINLFFKVATKMSNKDRFPIGRKGGLIAGKKSQVRGKCV